MDSKSKTSQRDFRRDAATIEYALYKADKSKDSARAQEKVSY